MGEEESERHTRPWNPFARCDTVETLQQRREPLAVAFPPGRFDRQAELAARQRAPGERRDPRAHALLEEPVAQRLDPPGAEFRLLRSDRKGQEVLQRLELIWRMVGDADLANLP